MNAEAQARYAARAAADKAAGGLAAARSAALGLLALKTVLKEAHAQPVLALEYSPADATANLFATVGGDQATIYDDDHLCGHVAVVAQFDSRETEHAPGGDLTTCAWVAPPPSLPDPDAVLAVGGAGAVVTILSVVEGRAVALLKGHAAPLADLAGAAGRPLFLASLDRAGVLVAWRVAFDGEGDVLAAWDAGDAVCVAAHPSGAFLATGHRSGDVKFWPLPAPDAPALARPDPASLPARASAADAGATPLTPAPPARRALDAPVASLLWLGPAGARLAALGGDGRGAVYDAPSPDARPPPPTLFRGPGAGGLGAAGGRCRLGATRDGAYLAVGGPAGEATVVDAATGARAAAVPPPPRVKAAARAVGVSNDGRRVIVAAGGGFMFRHEAREAVVGVEAA